MSALARAAGHLSRRFAQTGIVAPGRIVDGLVERQPQRAFLGGSGRGVTALV